MKSCYYFGSMRVALIAMLGLTTFACGEADESSEEMNDAGGVTAGEPAAGEPAAGEPAAGEMMAGTAMIVEPVAGEAMAGEAVAGEVAMGGDDSPSGMCDINGLTPAVELASGDGSNLTYSALTAEESPFDRIVVQSLGDWNGPTEPGVYSLDGINYADCGLCLLAYTGCTAEGCEKTMYAQEGEVEITSIGLNNGDRFTARLNNVVFREVTIDTSTFTSTEVADGQTWCLNDYALDQELVDPNQSTCERPEINCLGESIPDYNLLSCATGEMVSSRSLMDEKEKGLWMILTAGWCSACRQFIPQIREQETMFDELGVNIIYVMGEDSNYAEPDLMDCQSYANSYGEGALDRFYIDYSAEGSFYSTFTNLWPYTGPQGEFGLPWNGMVRSGAGNYEYVYADGSNTGDVNTGLNALISP